MLGLSQNSINSLLKNTPICCVTPAQPLPAAYFNVRLSRARRVKPCIWGVFFSKLLMMYILALLLFFLPITGWTLTVQVQKVVPSLFSEFSNFVANQHKHVDSPKAAETYLKKTFQSWAGTMGYVIPGPESIDLSLREINDQQHIVFYEIKIRTYQSKSIGKITLRYEDLNPTALNIDVPQFPFLGKHFSPQTLDEKLATYRKDLLGAGFIYSRVQATVQTPTPQSVNILITLHLGKRHVFKFNGNKVLPKSLLIQTTTERHQPGFTQSDIEQLVKTIYYEQGFVDVEVPQVHIYFSPEKHTQYITAFIQEGPRYHLASPHFYFRDDKANNIVYAAFADYIQQDAAHQYFSTKNIESFSPFFVDWMKDHGFYQSQIIAKPPEPHADRYWVTPVFDVVTGPQALFEQLTIEPEVVPHTQTSLPEIFEPFLDHPFGKTSIQNALDQVKEQLRQAGYLDVDQQVEISRNYDVTKPDSVLISLKVTHTLGRQYIFKARTYQNTCGTSPWVLDRYLTLTPEGPYDPSKLEASVANLYRSELFRSIDITPKDDVKGDRIERSISLRFFCGIRGNHEFGAGFFSETGFKLFSNFSYRNLFQGNQTVFVNTDLNIRLPPYFTYVEPHIGISLLWPYLFKWPFDTRLSTDFRIVDQLDLDTTTWMMSLDFEKSFTQWFKLILHVYEFSLEFQHHFVNEPNRTEFARLGQVGVTTEFNFTNHPRIPTQGHKHIVSGHLSSPALGSSADVSFVRAESNHSIYVSPFPTDRVVLAGNTILGLIQTFDNADYIPRSEFFFLGGDASLRGFDIRSVGLNTQVNARTIQSMAVINFRSELRLKTFEDFFVFGFWDTGTLWANFAKISDFRHATGGGIRWHTPLGGVNLAVGFPIDDLGPPPNLVPGRTFDDFKIHLSLSSF